MKEEIRISQPNHLTAAEFNNPIGEINRLGIVEFNAFSKAVYDINKKRTTLLEIRNAKDEISEEFGSTMEKVGLGLRTSPDVKKERLSLQIRVMEPEKTVKFLKTVDDNPDMQTQLSMALLIRSIFAQINEEFNKRNGPSVQSAGLILDMKGFINEFTRMSVKTDVIYDIETYLNHARSFTFKECIAVINSGILAKPKKTRSAPGEWHSSMSTIEHAKAWGKAFDVLDIVKENPLAGELYGNVLSSLELGVEDALEKVRNPGSVQGTLLIAKRLLELHRSPEDS